MSDKPAVDLFPATWKAMLYILSGECEQANCQPTLNKRRAKNEKIKLVLPIGGTRTDAYLYTPETFEAFLRNRGKYTQAIRHSGVSYTEGNPAFDLSSLSDGKYIINMVSCGVGGVFEVYLTTKD